MARFALLFMLGWMPGHVLAFASTARNPVKDEAQRELDAELAVVDGRQSRFMAPSGRRRSWSWLSGMSSWSWSPPTQWGQAKSGGVADECGTCGWANDGDCDDGGPDADYSLCARGSDCNDCKPVCEKYVNCNEYPSCVKAVGAGGILIGRLNQGETGCTTSKAPSQRVKGNVGCYTKKALR